MGIDWSEEELNAVKQGMTTHPIESGRCAALARLVYAVAKPKDPNTRGIQIRPPRGARYLVPKRSQVPTWYSHTLVETQVHDVDAITGPDGHPADRYLEDHWHFHELIDKREVDVETVDPGIQDDDV